MRGCRWCCISCRGGRETKGCGLGLLVFGALDRFLVLPLRRDAWDFAVAKVVGGSVWGPGGLRFRPDIVAVALYLADVQDRTKEIGGS